MAKEKYWQYVRGICVLMVILIHTLHTTNNLYINEFNIIVRKIINFTVPVFFFIAGYFTKVKNLREFYKKKIIRLIPCLIIWNVIYTLFDIIVSNDFKFSIIKFILSYNTSHLYYIYVLVQLFMMAPLLIKISKTKYKYIPLFITFISNVIVVLLQVRFKLDFSIYRYLLLGWITYYYFGLLIRDLNLKNNIIKIICTISLCLSIGEGICIYGLNNNLYSLAVTQLAIFNVLYSLCICYLIYINKKEKKESLINTLLIEIGDFSFGMYLSHILILSFVKKIYSLLEINYYTSIILIFITTTMITYGCNKIYYVYIKGMIKWKK